MTRGRSGKKISTAIGGIFLCMGLVNLPAFQFGLGLLLPLCSLLSHSVANVCSSLPPPLCFTHERGRATFQATAIDSELATTSSSVSLVDHRHKRSRLCSSGAMAVENAALAYGAPPKAVTFKEAFLENTEAFFLAMDRASHGHFLRDHVVGEAGAGTGWAETGLAGTGSARTGPPRSSTGDNIALLPSDTSRQAAAKQSKGGLMTRKSKVPSSSSSVSSLLAEFGLAGSKGGGRGSRAPVGSVAAAPVSVGTITTPTTGEDWVQSPWLVAMGGFTLAGFLVNRF